jgi:hypothetical protein
VGYSLELLPAWERARRYRELAAEVIELADYTRSPEMRESYLDLATNWCALAEQLEARIERGYSADSTNARAMR